MPARKVLAWFTHCWVKLMPVSHHTGRRGRRVFARVLALATVAIAAAAENAMAQLPCDGHPFMLCPDCPGCRTFLDSPTPFAQLPGAADETGSSATGQQPAQQPAPAPTDLAGLPAGFGASRTGPSAVPNMIGDLLGGGSALQTSDVSFLSIPTAGGGGALGRFQISENNSPLPQNRFYFNYSHFHNSQIFGPHITSLDRYTPGFEKTFLDGLMSYQIALPFTSGLGSDIELLNENLLAPSAIPQDAELGDLALALKAILWQRPRYAVAGGLAVTLPTADDFVYSETFIDTVGVFSELRIENEAVHLKPYLGFLYLPNDRCFIQGFAQLDFDTNGNLIVETFRIDDDGSIDEQIASTRYHDQNLVTLDLSVGHWLYRNPARRYIQGVAGIVELHYTSTINNTNLFFTQNTGFVLQNPFNRVDLLNLTAGVHLQIGPLATLRIATAVPLRQEDPVEVFGATYPLRRPFDAEFVVQFNRFF